MNMKRNCIFTMLTILFMALGCFNNLSAQVKFSSDESDIEMISKRLVSDGSTVTIVGTIVWHGKTDCRISCAATELKIVDDEGVVYDYKNIRFDIGNTTILNAPNGFVKTDSFVLTSGVPFRFKLIVRDVDEYARAFELVEINPSILPENTSMGYTVELKCRSLQFPPLE